MSFSDTNFPSPTIYPVWQMHFSYKICAHDVLGVPYNCYKIFKNTIQHWLRQNYCHSQRHEYNTIHAKAQQERIFKNWGRGGEGERVYLESIFKFIKKLKKKKKIKGLRQRTFFSSASRSSLCFSNRATSAAKSYKVDNRSSSCSQPIRMS